jgi:hypothetical protein
MPTRTATPRFSSRGVRRRIEALACLGWTAADIGDRLGVKRATVNSYRHVKEVWQATHYKVDRVYRELCMSQAPYTSQSMFVKNLARKNKWSPPLAWDNIDTDERAKKDAH